jgi:hypothetical protein
MGEISLILDFEKNSEFSGIYEDIRFEECLVRAGKLVLPNFLVVRGKVRWY